MEATQRIHKDLYRILGHVNENAGDIKWWICGGTLLGALRERRIISNDEDGDICVLAQDIDSFIQNISADCISVYPWWFGYRISLASGKEMVYEGTATEPWHNTFRFPFVDVFIMVTDEEGVVRLPHKTMEIARCRNWSKEMHQTFIGEFYFPEKIENLDTATLGVLTLPIPSNAEKYLERVYGDWRKPVEFGYEHGVFAE